MQRFLCRPASLVLLALLSCAGGSSPRSSWAPSEFHITLGTGEGSGTIGRGVEPFGPLLTEDSRSWVELGWTWALGRRTPPADPWQGRYLDLLETRAAEPAPEPLPAPWPTPLPAPGPKPARLPDDLPPAPGPTAGLGGAPGEEPAEAWGGEAALLGAGLTAAALAALLKRRALAALAMAAGAFLRAGVGGLLPGNRRKPGGCPDEEEEPPEPP